MKLSSAPGLRAALACAALLLALTACGGGEEVSRLIGARCDTHSECDERCLGPSPDYPGGFCSASCNSNADCPMDAVCVDDDGGVCLFECRLDEHCAFLGATWRCTERDHVLDGKVMVCRGD